MCGPPGPEVPAPARAGPHPWMTPPGARAGQGPKTLLRAAIRLNAPRGLVVSEKQCSDAVSHSRPRCQGNGTVSGAQLVPAAGTVRSVRYRTTAAVAQALWTSRDVWP